MIAAKVVQTGRNPKFPEENSSYLHEKLPRKHLLPKRFSDILAGYWEFS